jgi:hypothetical protein
MQAANIPVVRVQSAVIAGVGYCANTQTLVVTFVNGHKYAYAQVPQNVAMAFFTPAITEDDAGNVTFGARSVGRYFNAQVRGKYVHAKLS